MIEYRDGKQLPPEALEKLFLSIGWESGKEPVLLSKALQNYGAVLTAWEGEELIGLIAAMDDGFLTAYVHYLLVRADRQSAGIGGAGIGGELLERLKARYASFHKIAIIGEHPAKVFYERHGFAEEPNASPMYFFPQGR